jgi:hypothetical protein
MTPELNDLQQGALKSKIAELRSALFFTESSSIVKLPTHVVAEVEVDNEGQIWFVIPRPKQNIEAFEKEIPAKMDFFRKGKDFFVKIRGKAFLITDSAEYKNNSELSSSMQEKMSNKELMTVKVVIVDSELVDNTPKAPQNWLQSSRSQLSSWFF